MGTTTAISWTDHTFNPWIGCTKVSPGCAHCYAETLMDHRHGKARWGKGNPRVRTAASTWAEPRKWDRAAVCASDRAIAAARLHGEPEPVLRPRVFCASLADWLDDEVPIAWLKDLLDLIHVTPHLDWLLLTKRPQHFQNRLIDVLHLLWRHDHQDLLAEEPERDEHWMDSDEPEPGTLAAMINDWTGKTPPANVWIGTSVEDQQRADERIPYLLQIPAKVHFLSCEPILGPVDVSRYMWPVCESWTGPHRSAADARAAGVKTTKHKQALVLAGSRFVNWVIAGGESGPNARPMHPAWARSLRDQCAAANVPFHFKQWGEWTPHRSHDAARQCHAAIHRFAEPDDEVYRLGKTESGHCLDGIEHLAFPTTDAGRVEA